MKGDYNIAAQALLNCRACPCFTKDCVVINRQVFLIMLLLLIHERQSHCHWVAIDMINQND